MMVVSGVMEAMRYILRTLRVFSATDRGERVGEEMGKRFCTELPDTQNSLNAYVIGY